MTTAKERFKQAADPFRAAMDQQAVDIFDELVKGMKITAVLPKPKEIFRNDDDVITFEQFNGKDVGVMMAHFAKPELDFISEQVDDIRHMQFRSHRENVLFSRGTKNLLALLTKYCYMKTEKVIIAAAPDSLVSGGPAGDKSQSFINESHLTGDEAIYDDERCVSIFFLLDNRFICLNFREKIKSA